MIDLKPLKALLADAQRKGSHTVELPYTDLQALIHKVHMIQEIEEHIPKQIGYCAPDEIREMCNGSGKVARVKRSPWSDFTVPIYFMGQLPKREKPIDVVAET
jgi:hypothetical protein